MVAVNGSLDRAPVRAFPPIIRLPSTAHATLLPNGDKLPPNANILPPDTATLPMRARILLVIAVVLPACISMEGTVRDRASVDFNCPTFEITIDAQTGDSYTASGCGIARTYQCTPATEQSALHNPTCVQQFPDAGR